MYGDTEDDFKILEKTHQLFKEKKANSLSSCMKKRVQAYEKKK